MHQEYQSALSFSEESKFLHILLFSSKLAQLHSSGTQDPVNKSLERTTKTSSIENISFKICSFYHALVVLDHPLGVESSVDKRPLVFCRTVHHRHRVVLKIMIIWDINNHEHCSISLEFTQRMQKIALMQKMFWPAFQLSIKDLLPPSSEYQWASSPRCRRILAPSFDHKVEFRNNPYLRCLAPRTEIIHCWP